MDNKYEWNSRGDVVAYPGHWIFALGWNDDITSWMKYKTVFIAYTSVSIYCDIWNIIWIVFVPSYLSANFNWLTSVCLLFECVYDIVFIVIILIIEVDFAFQNCSFCWTVFISVIYLKIAVCFSFHLIFWFIRIMLIVIILIEFLLIGHYFGIVLVNAIGFPSKSEWSTFNQRTFARMSLKSHN